MKTNWFKRTLCSILAFVMVLGYVPATAFASEADGLCEHHTQHTTECGYSAAVAGHDCGHAHTEECYQSVTECVHTHGDCGYVPAVEGQSCDCQPDENGEIVHTEGCGYVEAAAEVPCDHVCSEETGCVTKALNCQHQHDAACGYAKETAETPCGFECADCAEGASDEPAPTEYYGSTATEADTTWGLRGASTFSLEGNSSDSLSSGFYRITTKLDREYKLTLSSSSYSCVTTGESDAQVFYVSQLENGYFVIYDSSKTSVVTARSSEFAENTQMELQEYSEIPQQHWFILPADGEDGSYYIVTAENDMFLDVDNATCEENAIVQLFPRNVLYDAQNWFFEPCENYGDSDNCSCSEQYAGNYVVSNTSEVAIRDGHSVEGNILGKIPLGTELVITKASGAAGNSDAWGHVTYNGISGYIQMAYVARQMESFGSGNCGANGSNVTWNLTSDGTLTISGSGAMKDYASYSETPWYNNREKIKSVTIEQGVTSIGAYAFMCCRSLTSVTIPSSVTSIGYEAFEFCDSLTSVTIPNSVTSIGGEAFYNCSSLTSVTIPSSVTSIGYKAFSGCSSLTDINVDPDNKDWCSVDGVLFSKDRKTLAAFPGGRTGEYQCPDGVTSIGFSAFSYCSSLTSVTIPNSVTSIGGEAFYNCSSLTSVTIPSSVTSIGYKAFSGCSSLTDINVDPDNKDWCSVDGVLFSKDRKTLAAFPGGRTGEYQCPDGVTSIGFSAFLHCSSLTSVTIPNSVTSIGSSAFYNCSSLTSVTIPNSVTYIGENVFARCSSLASVTIPNSVTSIGNMAFYYCSSLKDVYYGGTEERWTTIEIGEENEPLTDATIHYGAMDSDTIVSTGFQFGVDTFSFDNDFLAFGNSHYISDNDYKELLKTMPLFWELVFRYDDMYDRTFSKNQFNGVCFGISALMALVYYDYISLDPYVSMCVEPYQLPLPKDYPDLNSLFNYVYGLQFRFKPLLFGDPQWLCGKTVVQDLLNKKLVIINFQTHSVLGYAIDAQSDDECYIVYCADPNELTGDPLRLKISKRTYELVDTKSKFSFIFDNFELMATLLPQSANRINNETQYSKVSLFATNSSSFVISGDGKTSTVCGDDISGDFPIEAMHFVYGDEVHSNVYSISISSGYNVLFTDEAKHYAAAYFPESNVVTHIESDADEITVMPAGELRFSGALGSTTVRTNAAFEENNTLISISGAFAELQMIPSHDKLTMLSDTGIDGLSITITSDTKQDTLEADVNGHSATLVQKKADGLEPYYSLLRDDNTTIIDTPHDYVLFNVSTLGLDNSATIYIDGIEYQLESDDSIIINDANAHTMVTYSYNNPKATDVHTQYPTGMKVWKLKQENGVYTATYVPELDNLLQYSGSSIRITGNKGIRMITSINQDTRNKLTGNSLAGFKLLEYGTLLAQTSKLGNDPLVLGGANVKSNYAYKKDVADPVFKYADGLIQYTNVLIGFTDEQCKEDIAMRPYMKLLDENGEEFVIYGGIVYRSIGYIAYQNRNAFQPRSAAYEYVWSIIHNVYGNQYDSEYKK